MVRRFPGTRTGLGALGISLIVLGMLDNAALTPLASVAAVDADSWTVRAGFGVVAVAGVLAAVVIALLPRATSWPQVTRFRLGRWLGGHTHCTSEACAAWVLVSVSWALRGTAVFLLLNALSMTSSFPLALAFLCASAASAALPIAPAGAATQAGAGAAILDRERRAHDRGDRVLGRAQALIIVTGAVVILFVAAWQLGLSCARASPARLAGRFGTAPVCATKSRWRTSTNASAPPTNATIAATNRIRFSPEMYALVSSSVVRGPPTLTRPPDAAFANGAAMVPASSECTCVCEDRAERRDPRRDPDLPEGRC